MKNLKLISLLLVFILKSLFVTGQLSTGVYISEVENEQHEIKIAPKYLVYTVFQKFPAKFIKTIGGYYKIENNELNLQLEFNSDYQTDSISSIKLPIKFKANGFVLDEGIKQIFTLQKKRSQTLDGQWLFATRGPDTGQERRDDNNSRKTLKFLLDGRFQWIAYHTENYKFSGTGGGIYTAKNGVYIENIEYFSKDNTRVGASLEFNYELKERDWHHTGTNSKGKPMYEIWAKR